MGPSMWCVYCMLLNAVNECKIKLYVKGFFNSRWCRELAFECFFYSIGLYILNFLCAWGVCVFLCVSMNTHISEDKPKCWSLPSTFETGCLVHHFPCQPSWPTSFQGVSCLHLPSHYRSLCRLCYWTHSSVGRRNQNSGPDTCAAIALPTVSSPQPLALLSVHIRVSSQTLHAHLFKTRFSYSPSQYVPGWGSPAPCPLQVQTQAFSAYLAPGVVGTAVSCTLRDCWQHLSRLQAAAAGSVGMVCAAPLRVDLVEFEGPQTSSGYTVLVSKYLVLRFPWRSSLVICQSPRHRFPLSPLLPLYKGLFRPLLNYKSVWLWSVVSEEGGSLQDYCTG